MTGNRQKFRAVFLAALMVLSVFAGTVAFAGTAAAAEELNSVSAENVPVGQSSVDQEVTFAINPTSETETITLVTGGLPVTGVAASVSDDSTLEDSDGATLREDGDVTLNITDGGTDNVETVTVTLTHNTENSDTASGVNMEVTDGSTTASDTFDITAPSGSISGTVSNYDTAGDVTVELIQDGEVVDTINGIESDDSYTFSEVADGDYTVRAYESGEGAASEEVTVDGGSSETGITLSLSNDASPNYDPSGTVFAGQDVVVSDLVPGDEYTLRSVDSYDGDDISSSSFEDTYVANSTGQIEISTEGRENGDYYVRGPGLTTSPTQGDTFEITGGDLNVEFEDDSVDNNGETLTDLEIDSNRGTYSLNVSADNLDYEELHMIFNDDFDTIVNHTDDDIIELQGVTDDTYETNFSDVDGGNYTFDFEYTDTGSSDSASIVVNDVGDGSADFETQTLTTQQGEIAQINITLSEAATGGTLLIGNEDDSGYEAVVSFSDDSEDDEVSINFNTYTAGMNVDDTVTVENDDDEITFDPADETNLSDILDTGDYELAVTTGNVEDARESPDNVGSLYIEQRSISGANVWTAPSDVDLGDEDPEDVVELINEGQITQDSTIAAVQSGSGVSDYVVYQLQATGLEGYIEAAGGMSNALDADGIRLSVEQENPSSNRPEKVLDVENSTFTYVEDGDNGTYYILFRPGSGSVDYDYTEAGPESGQNQNVQLSDGDRFNASFVVRDDRLLDSDDSDDHQEVGAIYETVDREINFDNDPANVSASAEQTVTGTTSLAAGSEITVRVRSDDDTQPRFIKNAPEVNVTSDGTWAATYDFSEQSVGDGFTITASKAGLSTEVDGNVVEQVNTETPTATPEETTEANTETTATPTETTDTPTETATAEPDTPTPEPATESPTETGTTTPGFGVVVALVALLAAALLAVRRD